MVLSVCRMDRHRGVNDETLLGRSLARLVMG